MQYELSDQEWAPRRRIAILRDCHDPQVGIEVFDPEADDALFDRGHGGDGAVEATTRSRTDASAFHQAPSAHGG
jgi:transposase